MNKLRKLSILFSLVFAFFVNSMLPDRCPGTGHGIKNFDEVLHKCDGLLFNDHTSQDTLLALALRLYACLVGISLAGNTMFRLSPERLVTTFEDCCAKIMTVYSSQGASEISEIVSQERGVVPMLRCMIGCRLSCIGDASRHMGRMENELFLYGLRAALDGQLDAVLKRLSGSLASFRQRNRAANLLVEEVEMIRNSGRK